MYSGQLKAWICVLIGFLGLAAIPAADSFNSGPVLTVTRVGSTAQLSWTGDFGQPNFIVEQSESLGQTAVWKRLFFLRYRQ